MMSNKLNSTLLIGFTFTVFGCPGIRPEEPSILEPSLSETIAGLYEGNVKNMPQGISLGRYVGCIIPPGWDANFRNGTGTINITAVNDSTVRVHLTGQHIPPLNSTDLLLSDAGGTINLKIGSQIEYGFFDKATRYLTITTRTGSYFTNHFSCLIGLPYYIGNDLLMDGHYNYTTVGHVEFSGIKIR